MALEFWLNILRRDKDQVFDVLLHVFPGLVEEKLCGQNQFLLHSKEKDYENTEEKFFDSESSFGECFFNAAVTGMLNIQENVFSGFIFC